MNESAAHARDPFAALARASVALAGLALLGLVAVQGWQVVARYLLNDSPGWTEPVALLLLVGAMSFGAAAAVHERRHFAFGLLAASASPRLQRVLAACSFLVQLGCAGVLAFWSARLLLDGWQIKLAGAPLPQSVNFAPLLLGSALMAVFAAHGLWQSLRAPASTRPEPH